MIDKIVFATNNKDKLREVREILKDLDIEILSPREVGVHIDIDETGKSFEENALIKAREISRLSKLPTMADDSGLIIDEKREILGINSARFLGHDTDYRIKNAEILRQMLGISNRKAWYECAIALVLKDGREFVSSGILDGEIALEAKGDKGFGYDPIFLLKEYNKTAAELSDEEKNRISHRGKAVRNMKNIIDKLLAGEY